MSAISTREPMRELTTMLETEPAGIIEEIAPEDDMYGVLRNHVNPNLDQETAEVRARAVYFRQGQSALECIELALLTARREEPRRILDFGCGHGRVLRMIKARFPEAQLTACDLDRGAVDFCADTFGASPVYSDMDPEAITIQGDFDLIWSGSVLTHLDRPRWEGLLSLFESHLSSGGVLVFTTNGRKVAELHRRSGTPEHAGLADDFERTGFGYRNLADADDYGTSLARPSWVCALLERRPRLRLVLLAEHAWNNHQDVVACVRAEDRV